MSKKKDKFEQASQNAILNLAGHNSTAAMSVTVTEDSWSGGRVSGEICISDCIRQISLDIRNEDEYENSLYKLDAMIDMLKFTRTQFVRINAVAVKKKAKRDKRDKQGKS